MSIPT